MIFHLSTTLNEVRNLTVPDQLVLTSLTSTGITLNGHLPSAVYEELSFHARSLLLELVNEASFRIVFQEMTAHGYQDQAGNHVTNDCDSCSGNDWVARIPRWQRGARKLYFPLTDLRTCGPRPSRSNRSFSGSGIRYRRFQRVESGNRNYKKPFCLDRKVPKTSLTAQSSDFTVRQARVHLASGA